MTKKDSEGNKLSKQQQEYFKNSKVIDKNGNLKVMKHGTNAEFTVFEKKYSKGSNLYGRGFYFTDSESHSSQYGNSKEYYLDIQNPLSQNTKIISKEQLKKFVSEIANNEDYGIENYGYGATVDSVVNDVFGKSDFDMLQDINATCVGDLVETVKIFNEINGTNYDGFILPTETVIFDSKQAKLTNNLNPTSNPDIRYSKGMTESLRKTDTEYLELAKNPEKNKSALQEMVYDAAQNAGLEHVGLHGTAYFGFTQFEHNKGFKPQKSSQAKAFFFTNKYRVAESYSGVKGTTEIIKANGTQGNYKVALDTKNPLMIDCNYSLWNNIQFNGKTMTTDAIVEYAKKKGYDGVIFENLIDSANLTDFTAKEKQSEEFKNKWASTVTAVFDSNQIKSLDPVTYDDEGNVIPLSERFNSENDDIRYSIKTDIVDVNGKKYDSVIDVDDEFTTKSIKSRSYERFIKRMAGQTVGVIDIDGKKETITFAKENDRVKKGKKKSPSIG